MAGRPNNSKVTAAETGFPGRPSSGVAPSSAVACDAQPHRYGAGASYGRREVGRVALVNLARSRRFTKRNQFVAGRQDGDARPAMDARGMNARGGKQRDLRRPQLCARRHEQRAGPHVFPRPADVVAGGRLRQQAHLIAGYLGQLLL